MLAWLGLLLLTICSFAMANATEPVTRLDIVAVATTIAAWAFGPQAAGIIGPYAVILLASLGGAAWAAASTKEKGSSLTHVLVRMGFSIGCTTVIADICASVIGIEPQLLFAAVAFMLAYKPEWVIHQLRSIWDRRSSGNNPRRTDDEPK